MKTLTKKITILLLFSTFFSSAALTEESREKNIKQYDTLFDQIGEQRVGLSTETIASVDNPFFMEKKKAVEPADSNTSKKIIKPEYVLNGTLNKKAKINDSWYALNSTIGEYKLVQIKSNRVVLQNKHIKKELYIRKPNAVKIQFSSK